MNKAIPNLIPLNIYLLCSISIPSIIADFCPLKKACASSSMIFISRGRNQEYPFTFTGGGSVYFASYTLEQGIPETNIQIMRTTVMQLTSFTHQRLFITNFALFQLCFIFYAYIKYTGVNIY